MSPGPSGFEAPTVAGASDASLPHSFVTGEPRYVVILASGALAFPGTSSTMPGRLWPDPPYVHEARSTTSGSAELAPSATETETAFGEDTRRAVSELRRISGLTWDQLAQLFHVSRRSVHFWASGKPLNAPNEERLLRILDVVREADRGDARATRMALLTPSDGVVPFDLLADERFEEAAILLGKGPGRRHLSRTELDPREIARRKPRPPEELVDALHDRVHRDIGRGRPARTARNQRRERGR